MRRLFLLLFLLAVYNCHSGLAADNSLEDIKEIDNTIEPAPRIVGGTGVSIFNRNRPFTYVVRLQINFGFGSNTVCSGVVLDTKHILTVAHCVARPGKERAQSVWVRILGGGIYLFTKDDIRLHPGYNGLYGNDVAILKKSNWALSTFMRGYGTVPKLPTEDNTYDDDTPAVIAGWGKTSDTRWFSSTLHYANVAISSAECETTFENAIASMQDDQLICTSWNSAGLCAGDWGGPLLVNKSGDTLLIGLNLVRGTDSCKSNTPSGYLVLSQQHVDWIKKEIK